MDTCTCPSHSHGHYCYLFAVCCCASTSDYKCSRRADTCVDKSKSAHACTLALHHSLACSPPLFSAPVLSSRSAEGSRGALSGPRKSQKWACSGRWSGFWPFLGAHVRGRWPLPCTQCGGVCGLRWAETVWDRKAECACGGVSYALESFRCCGTRLNTFEVPARWLKPQLANVLVRV